MKTSILKLLKLPTTIITIVLLIACLILHFLFINNFHEYPSGIITEFIGIIVTIIFVQILFDKRNERLEKRKEYDEIQRINKLLQLYFVRYNKCVATLVSPAGEATYKEKIEYKDLANIYNPSLDAQNGLLRPAIEYFFEIERQIVTFIEQLLANKTFYFYPNISQIFESFVGIHLLFNCSGAVLETFKINAGNKQKKETDIEMLKNSTNETYIEFKKVPTLNMHTTYIYLYDLITEEQKLYFKYRYEIDKVMSEYDRNSKKRDKK